MTEEIFTYIIRNVANKSIWSTPEGKRFWLQPGHAKSAYVHHSHKWPDKRSFNQQTEYECVRCKIVPYEIA